MKVELKGWRIEEKIKEKVKGRKINLFLTLIGIMVVRHSTNIYDRILNIFIN